MKEILACSFSSKQNKRKSDHGIIKIKLPLHRTEWHDIFSFDEISGTETKNYYSKSIILYYILRKLIERLHVEIKKVASGYCKRYGEEQEMCVPN